jgi:hypothetical protein
VSNWWSMDWLSHLLAPLGSYPRWFVIVCVVLVAVGACWLLAKLIKWTFYVVILFVLLGAVLFVAAWWLG